MHCPHCPHSTLVISERSGIEIDYCPQCRGVWLDRGELDKLIERSMPERQHVARDPFADRDDRRESSERYDNAPRPDPRYSKHRSRKSWLSEIFD